MVRETNPVIARAAGGGAPLSPAPSPPTAPTTASTTTSAPHNAVRAAPDRLYRRVLGGYLEEAAADLFMHMYMYVYVHAYMMRLRVCGAGAGAWQAGDGACAAEQLSQTSSMSRSYVRQRAHHGAQWAPGAP